MLQRGFKYITCTRRRRTHMMNYNFYSIKKHFISCYVMSACIWCCLNYIKYITISMLNSFIICCFLYETRYYMYQYNNLLYYRSSFIDPLTLRTECDISDKNWLCVLYCCSFFFLVNCHNKAFYTYKHIK